MSDDGFTIVRRKYRNKVSQDKTERKRINGESNGHTTKSLSKRKETAKANKGKRSENSVMMGKAHYI
jgi:stress response protein YsnF